MSRLQKCYKCGRFGYELKMGLCAPCHKNIAREGIGRADQPGDGKHSRPPGHDPVAEESACKFNCGRAAVFHGKCAQCIEEENQAWYAWLKTLPETRIYDPKRPAKQS